MKRNTEMIDAMEAERLGYCSESDLPHKMRLSGELQKQIDAFRYDYCWFCLAWHEVCPLKGCNSCACGCPHGLSDKPDGCQPWWDAQNSAEYKEQQPWEEIHPNRPTLEHLIAYVQDWCKEPREHFRSAMSVVVDNLMFWSIPFIAHYDGNLEWVELNLEGYPLAENIEFDRRHHGMAYPPREKIVPIKRK